MKRCRLFLIDIKRMICVKTAACISFISVILLFMKYDTDNAFEWAVGIGSNSLFFYLSIAVATVPIVFAFIDDKEYGYHKIMKKKSSADNYIICKIFESFLFSAFVWVAGFVTAFIIKVITGDFVVINSEYIAYGYLLQDHKYLLYILAIVIQLSSFVGIISLCGVITASITNNRMLSVVIPILLVKIEDLFAYVISDRSEIRFNLYSFYMLFINSIEHDVIANALLLRILVLVLIFAILACLLYFVEGGEDK